MLNLDRNKPESIHCRTGSLEKPSLPGAIQNYIHCRTGSLEMYETPQGKCTCIHCRTGSLET